MTFLSFLPLPSPNEIPSQPTRRPVSLVESVHYVAPTNAQPVLVLPAPPPCSQILARSSRFEDVPPPLSLHHRAPLLHSPLQVLAPQLQSHQSRSQSLLLHPPPPHRRMKWAFMFVYVCMNVCMYICMYVCMYVCICMYVYVCMYMYLCMYICIYVSISFYLHNPFGLSFLSYNFRWAVKTPDKPEVCLRQIGKYGSVR